MNDIVTMINTVGFPIACCVALFYQNSKNIKMYQEFINSMQKTIDNNTLALKELSIRLTEEAKGYITDNSYDPVYGARPLKRFLQKKVDYRIADTI